MLKSLARPPGFRTIPFGALQGTLQGLIEAAYKARRK
jgi:hypothetical protein